MEPRRALEFATPARPVVVKTVAVLPRSGKAGHPVKVTPLQDSDAGNVIQGAAEDATPSRDAAGARAGAGALETPQSGRVLPTSLAKTARKIQELREKCRSLQKSLQTPGDARGKGAEPARRLQFVPTPSGTSGVPRAVVVVDARSATGRPPATPEDPIVTQLASRVRSLTLEMKSLQSRDQQAREAIIRAYESRLTSVRKGLVRCAEQSRVRLERWRATQAECERLRPALAAAREWQQHAMSTQDVQLQIAAPLLAWADATAGRVRSCAATAIGAAMRRLNEVAAAAHRIAPAVRAQAAARADRAASRAEAQGQHEVTRLKRALRDTHADAADQRHAVREALLSWAAAWPGQTVLAGPIRALARLSTRLDVVSRNVTRVREALPQLKDRDRANVRARVLEDEVTQLRQAAGAAAASAQARLASRENTLAQVRTDRNSARVTLEEAYPQWMRQLCAAFKRQTQHRLAPLRRRLLAASKQINALGPVMQRQRENAARLAAELAAERSRTAEAERRIVGIESRAKTAEARAADALSRAVDAEKRIADGEVRDVEVEERIAAIEARAEAAEKRAAEAQLSVQRHESAAHASKQQDVARQAVEAELAAAQQRAQDAEARVAVAEARSADAAAAAQAEAAVAARGALSSLSSGVQRHAKALSDRVVHALKAASVRVGDVAQAVGRAASIASKTRASRSAQDQIAKEASLSSEARAAALEAQLEALAQERGREIAAAAKVRKRLESQCNAQATELTRMKKQLADACIAKTHADETSASRARALVAAARRKGAETVDAVRRDLAEAQCDLTVAKKQIQSHQEHIRQTEAREREAAGRLDKAGRALAQASAEIQRLRAQCEDAEARARNAMEEGAARAKQLSDANARALQSLQSASQRETALEREARAHAVMVQEADAGRRSAEADAEAAKAHLARVSDELGRETAAARHDAARLEAVARAAHNAARTAQNAEQQARGELEKALSRTNALSEELGRARQHCQGLQSRAEQEAQLHVETAAQLERRVEAFERDNKALRVEKSRLEALLLESQLRSAQAESRARSDAKDESDAAQALLQDQVDVLTRVADKRLEEVRREKRVAQDAQTQLDDARAEIRELSARAEAAEARAKNAERSAATAQAGVDALRRARCGKEAAENREAAATERAEAAEARARSAVAAEAKAKEALSAAQAQVKRDRETRVALERKLEEVDEAKRASEKRFGNLLAMRRLKGLGAAPKGARR